MQRRTLFKLGLGAQLLTETRAERFELTNGNVTALICRNAEPNGVLTQAGHAQEAIKIIAKRYVLAGGAINSPAVLLRSGASQSIYTDHFLQTQAIDGPMGYKLAQGLAERLTGRDVALA